MEPSPRPSRAPRNAAPVPRRAAFAAAALTSLALLLALPLAAPGAGALAADAQLAAPASAPIAAPATTAPAAGTATTEAPRTAGSIGQPKSIPLPNTGAAPRDSGERGGALQQLVFFLICGVIIGGIGLIWLESRRKRRAQGRLPARS